LPTGQIFLMNHYKLKRCCAS